MACRTIDNGFKKPDAQHAWAVAANVLLTSVHVPIRPDATIEDGDARLQAEVTFADLDATLKAAGAGFGDVTMVQIFLTSLNHKPAVDDVYKRHFSEPYPVRACIAVSELPTPGTVIEVVVTAAIPESQRPEAPDPLLPR